MILTRAFMFSIGEGRLLCWWRPPLFSVRPREQSSHSPSQNSSGFLQGQPLPCKLLSRRKVSLREERERHNLVGEMHKPDLQALKNGESAAWDEAFVWLWPAAFGAAQSVLARGL